MGKSITPLEAHQKMVCALGQGDKTRKELIALGEKGLTKEEREDRRPGGMLNKRKCFFGKELDWLVYSGRVVVEDEIYKLVKRSKSTTKEAATQIEFDDKIRAAITVILKEQSVSKKVLFSKLMSKIAEAKDNNDFKSSAGQVLAAMVKSEEITVNEGVYALPSPEISKKEWDTTQENLNGLTPEELENNALALLQKVYEACGHKVHRCENTDGAADGGIDGIIEHDDELGFPEKIILQVKWKMDAKSVSQNHVKTFCGVLSVDDAAKGIFVTNGKYQAETKTFVKKHNARQKGLYLLDGQLFCALAKKYGFKLAKN